LMHVDALSLFPKQPRCTAIHTTLCAIASLADLSARHTDQGYWTKLKGPWPTTGTVLTAKEDPRVKRLP
jgi:hypothetical protein